MPCHYTRNDYAYNEIEEPRHDKTGDDRRRTAANAERVARWREQHIKRVDGEKERLTLVLDVGTKARLQRIADYYGYRSITALLESWAMQTASDVADTTERNAKEEIIRRSRKSP